MYVFVCVCVLKKGWGIFQMWNKQAKVPTRCQFPVNSINYIQPQAIPSEEAYQTHSPCHVDPSMRSLVHRHTTTVEIHYLYPKPMSSSWPYIPGPLPGLAKGWACLDFDLSSISISLWSASGWLLSPPTSIAWDGVPRAPKLGCLWPKGKPCIGPGSCIKPVTWLLGCGGRGAPLGNSRCRWAGGKLPCMCICGNTDLCVLGSNPVSVRLGWLKGGRSIFAGNWLLGVSWWMFSGVTNFIRAFMFAGWEPNGWNIGPGWFNCGGWSWEEDDWTWRLWNWASGSLIS